MGKIKLTKEEIDNCHKDLVSFLSGYIQDYKKTEKAINKPLKFKAFMDEGFIFQSKTKYSEVVIDIIESNANIWQNISIKDLLDCNEKLNRGIIFLEINAKVKINKDVYTFEKLLKLNK